MLDRTYVIEPLIPGKLDGLTLHRFSLVWPGKHIGQGLEFGACVEMQAKRVYVRSWYDFP